MRTTLGLQDMTLRMRRDCEGRQRTLEKKDQNYKDVSLEMYKI